MIRYSRLESIRIVKEARKATDICGLLKKYGLSLIQLETMQKEYASIGAIINGALKSMFLSDGSRNRVIVPDELPVTPDTDFPNFRTISTHRKLVFKSNLERHNFYVKNLDKFPTIYLPIAPWLVPSANQNKIYNTESH